MTLNARDKGYYTNMAAGAGWSNVLTTGILQYKAELPQLPSDVTSVG